MRDTLRERKKSYASNSPVVFVGAASGAACRGWLHRRHRRRQAKPAYQKRRRQPAGEALTLRLATVSEPSTLDPNLAEDYYSITPVEQMFLGLTNINNETAAIEPELAESWTDLGRWHGLDLQSAPGCRLERRQPGYR
jgi:ABC-type transport system substrate-binding protein